MTSAPNRKRYLLNETFRSSHAAGLHSPRKASPGPGKITFVETDGSYAVTGGLLDVTAQSTAAWGALGFYSAEITREAGRMFMADGVIIDATTTFGYPLAMSTGTDLDFGTAGNRESSLYFENGAKISYVTTTAKQTQVGTFAAATAYQMCTVMRATGSYHYIKGGTFTDWTLLYVGEVGSQNLRLCQSFFSHGGQIDNVRIPTIKWLPTPLAYDTFTRDDSDSLGSTETTGPDGQGCIARAWTESNGDWDISSNAMVPAGSSPGGAGWLVSHDVGEADAYCEMSFNLPAGSNTAGMLARYVDNDNLWQPQASQNTGVFSLWERTSGGWGQRASASSTVTADTTQTIKWTATGDVHRCWLNDGDYLTYTDSSSNTGTGYGCRHSGTSVKTEDITVWPVNPPDFPSV